MENPNLLDRMLAGSGFLAFLKFFVLVGQKIGFKSRLQPRRVPERAPGYDADMGRLSDGTEVK